jgi:hypothetical protein
VNIPLDDVVQLGDGVTQESLMFISGRFDQPPFHANDDGSANTGIAA